MRLHRLLFVLAALVAGCTSGKEFTKPDPASLTLGKTTRTDILAAYGPPRSQNLTVIGGASRSGSRSSTSPTDAEPASGQIVSLFYAYIDRTMRIIAGPGYELQRRVRFDFWNDKLIAYTFVSNRGSETNFDERNVAKLQSGRTTKAEVVDMFGEPVGRAIFPAVRNISDERFLYFFFRVSQWDGTRKGKHLEIFFDGDGKVRDYKFGSDFGPVPILPGPPAVPESEPEEDLPRS